MKERHDVKPDTALKTYWNRSEEFADLFNALLFNGREVIKAGDLREKDSGSDIVFETDDKKIGIQASRDLFRVVMRSDNTEYVLLGIENQDNIHYAMSLRDMEYTTYSYHKQYERIKEKYPNKKGLTGDEFLSHMKKEDKLTPIITAVIYYGDKEWDGAKSLYEMMEIPEELKPFVNDYKMNLIEARNTSLVFHNKNNRDLFRLLQLIYDKNNKSREQDAIDYANENKVDKSVMLAIGSTSGINLKIDEKEGDITMCTLFEEIKERGLTEGLTKGKAEGLTEGKAEGIIITCYEFGLPEEDILKRLQNKLEITEAQALNYLETYKNSYLQV